MSYTTRSSINVEDLLSLVQSEECGGTALFLGSVRAGPDDGPVTHIDYSAYEPMLETEFERIRKEALERWSGIQVNAVHRLGGVPVGEASIAVVVGAPHRAEAFAACEFIVEEAKQRLPVWKKEFLSDGSASWRANRLPGQRPGSQKRRAPHATPSP